MTPHFHDAKLKANSLNLAHTDMAFCTSNFDILVEKQFLVPILLKCMFVLVVFIPAFTFHKTSFRAANKTALPNVNIHKQFL